jgi:hypothetical protein
MLGKLMLGKLMLGKLMLGKLMLGKLMLGKLMLGKLMLGKLMLATKPVNVENDSVGERKMEEVNYLESGWKREMELVHDLKDMLKDYEVRGRKLKYTWVTLDFRKLKADHSAPMLSTDVQSRSEG